MNCLKELKKWYIKRRLDSFELTASQLNWNYIPGALVASLESKGFKVSYEKEAKIHTLIIEHPTLVGAFCLEIKDPSSTEPFKVGVSYDYHYDKETLLKDAFNWKWNRRHTSEDEVVEMFSNVIEYHFQKEKEVTLG